MLQKLRLLCSIIQKQKSETFQRTGRELVRTLAGAWWHEEKRASVDAAGYQRGSQEHIVGMCMWRTLGWASGRDEWFDSMPSSPSPGEVSVNRKEKKKRR